MDKGCVAVIWRGSVWSGGNYACGKPAKVERDGKPYCGLHDPERLAAIRATNDARFEIQADARKRDSAILRACQGLTAEQVEKAIKHCFPEKFETSK